MSTQRHAARPWAWLALAAGGWQGRLRVAVVAALVAVACAVLYAFPPREGGLYPPCLFHAATGLHCPGCGTLRAFHALLHGNVAAALGHNVMTILSLPFLAYAFLSWGRVAVGRRPLPRVFTSAAWVWLLLGLVLAYWVVRNVPVWPFSWLAP